MISQNILKLIGDAMKARDSVRVATLRSLSSELKNAKINVYDPNASEQRELTEQEEIAVIRREVKKRKEAIEMYEKAGASTQAESEKAELAILSEFLPAEVGREEIEKLVVETLSETGVSDVKEMGKVIGIVKQKNPNIDGSTLAEIVKSKLAS